MASHSPPRPSAIFSPVRMEPDSFSASNTMPTPSQSTSPPSAVHETLPTQSLPRHDAPSAHSSRATSPALARATPQNGQAQSPPQLTAPSNDLGASTPPVLDLDDIPSEAKLTYTLVLQYTSGWGESWTQCVDTFINFERSRGFQSQTFQLPASKQRPALFKKWITLKRPVSGIEWDALISGDGLTFGGQWWAWWKDVQPASRRVEGNLLA